MQHSGAALTVAPNRKRRLRQVAVWLLSSSLIGVALIGAAHTPVGRPLLAWLPGGPGCPALTEASPREVEAFRVAELRRRQGTPKPQSTPALGFELGVTTRTDVRSWADRHALRCKSERSGSVLRCIEVPPAATPGGRAIDDLYLQFDASERLVAVDAQHREGTAESAVAHLSSRAESLTRAVGPTTEISGDPTAGYLTRHRFARAEFEYRYRGYLAEISALNHGRGVVRVREQYQWAPEPGSVVAGERFE